MKKWSEKKGSGCGKTSNRILFLVEKEEFLLVEKYWSLYFLPPKFSYIQFIYSAEVKCCLKPQYNVYINS